MSSSTPAHEGANNGVAGMRTATVEDLKTLKTPEEGGNKKDFEDFIEKIYHHVMIQWPYGGDTAHVIRNIEDPNIKIPEELSDEDKKSGLKERIWNAKVDQYAGRILQLEENKNVLYALITDSIAKVMKEKLRAKKGYSNASESNDLIWLLEAMQDIMIRFEEIKPKILCMDDQMERIVRMKQGENTTNEDFLKQALKEIKV